MAGRSSDEFAVAAYRFAHSIIRPFYVVNPTSFGPRGVAIFGPDGGFNLTAGADPSDLVLVWNNILRIEPWHRSPATQDRHEPIAAADQPPRIRGPAP